MNIKYLCYTIGAMLLIASCTPKHTGVLRSPDQRKGTLGRPTDKESKETPIPEGSIDKISPLNTKNIALLLPFQLNKMTSEIPDEKDLGRSEMALDFFQGFQLGLENSAKDFPIELNVIDSKDDPRANSLLATSSEIQNAQLIVGPVYPQEIKSFGSNFNKPNVLQINPLAATMPTEFGLPNLVSITPPISVHMRALSAQVQKNYIEGDAIIVYDTDDKNHLQLMKGFLGDIQERLPEVEIIAISSIEKLNEKLIKDKTNHIITGTTDRYQLRTLLNNLDEKYNENHYDIHIYGHPLWDRLDFAQTPNFGRYKPTITAESHFDSNNRDTRQFSNEYKNRFGICISETACKGFDAGKYFGSLLKKYGDDYSQHITNESFIGIYNTYKFNKNERWGYVNFGLSIKVFSSGAFKVI